MHATYTADTARNCGYEVQSYKTSTHHTEGGATV